MTLFGYNRTSNLNIENAPAMRQTSRSVTETYVGGFDMSILPFKRCTKCGELKDRGEFAKDPQKKDGLYSSCKECYKARYQSNREQEVERVKRYQRENRDSVLTYKKKYYSENREIEIRKMAARREKRVEADKEYRRRNREKINAASALWSSLNKARRRLALRIWRKNHPEKTKAQKINRHARERGGAGSITAQEWQALKEFYNYTCLCCGRREPEIKLTLDHVKPLALGGTNTIDNAQCLCGSCNSRKHKKEIDYR